MNIQGHKTALEAAGFRVKGDTVVDRMGIEVAGNNRHGFWCKNDKVKAILAQPVAKPKPAPKPAPVVEPVVEEEASAEEATEEGTEE